MPPRLPRPLARRGVLYGPDTPREKLIELGHAYLERDLVFDAADFFAQARDREGLEVIKARAKEAGDAFLLRQVQTASPDLVSKSDWDQLARAAGELGKEAYAELAAGGGAPPPPPLQEEEEPDVAAEEGGPGEATEEGKAARARGPGAPAVEGTHAGKRRGRGRKRGRQGD